MADQQQSISAAFPAPPPFYKHFTEASLTQLAELRGSLGSVSGSVSGSQKPLHSLLDLPSELQYLQPPVPPSDGKYRSFGEDRMVCFLFGLFLLLQYRDSLEILPTAKEIITVCAANQYPTASSRLPFLPFLPKPPFSIPRHRIRLICLILPAQFYSTSLSLSTFLPPTPP